EVLIERHAAGSTYRLLLIDGRLIAALRRDPAQVVGDGRSTIAQLIDEANADPRRGDEPSQPLRKIVFDDDAVDTLADQGYSPTSVPPAGERVLAHRKPHRMTGAADVDVTDLVHPDVVACAARAAQIMGIEVAGLDLVVSDISRPLEEQGGVVLEV